eukprot:gnl/TRDRNA2_/TRDRNA2_93518_c0_seq1.p1 gnl/TRDRNA2_/TRDRNA2_93518_c0~~gnl/TRDRNA2_/TRDRNA2_93518_c0_seq1.p1  ORF type:complete len:311 (-),score=78.47 gnl/TRDRNA2_/TRDRNA2_93518_c0_seq1:27-959(-)
MAAQWCRLLLLLALVAALLSCCMAATLDQEEPAGEGDESGVEDEQPEPPPEGYEYAMTDEQLLEVHTTLDANKDEKVNIAEMLDFQKKMRVFIAKLDLTTIFEELDGNKNGLISLGETTAHLVPPDQTFDSDLEKEWHRKQRAFEEAKFRAADKDKDGQLTKEELPAFMNHDIDDAMMEAYAQHAMVSRDSDQDGVLNVTEFWIGESLINYFGEQDNITEEQEVEFKRVDKNGDGKVDVKELEPWEAGISKMVHNLEDLFSIADSDKDGHLTSDELKASADTIAGIDVHDHLQEWWQYGQDMRERKDDEL